MKKIKKKDFNKEIIEFNNFLILHKDLEHQVFRRGNIEFIFNTLFYKIYRNADGLNIIVTLRLNEEVPSSTTILSISLKNNLNNPVISSSILEPDDKLMKYLKSDILKCIRETKNLYLSNKQALKIKLIDIFDKKDEK